ncbi:kinase-like domain-containing protein [Phakopsora pachyrhizi]|nr:kinase-like domain-containing protein [Phakopsora pachyrhizi]
MSQPKDSKERSDPIPKLYSSFQSETDLNLLLEFLPNGSLSDFILTNRPSLNSLTGEDLMRVWFAELVLALDWLHRVSGFVHRDFKPSNVLVDGNGHLVLNDFGCSTKLYRHSSSTVKSKHHNNSSNDTVEEPEGFLIDRYISRLKNQRVFYRFDPLLVSNSSCKVLVGTCDYISLNQDSDDEDSDTEREDQRAEDEGLGPYGNEIDFWSLGISIYEIIYGQPTFFCQSISETYDKIVSHPEHLVVPKCRNSLVELDSELECDDQIVSDELRHLIKSLLTTRDVRIGCGKDGVEDFKRHSFFKGLDWNSLRSYRLNDFKAVPIEIDYNQKSSHQSMNDTGKFNFSNFFNNSSPGLSILKDSRNQLKEQSSNEAEMVQGKKEEIFD